MTRSTSATPHQRGVSLLELLIGIVISMLTVLIITQVFLNSEKHRRIPAAGANTQVNGILALDAIQRDVRQSGYGLGGGAWMGQCNTGASAAAAAVGLANLQLAPLLITPGSGDAPSDSIEVLSSGKVDAAMQIRLAEKHDEGNSAFIIRTPMGVEAGDWLVVSSKAGLACAAFQAQAISIAAPWGVTPSASVAGDYDDESRLSNMGASPVRRRWSVTGSPASPFALQMTDLANDAPTPSANDAYPDVVLLRALYGKDTDNNGAIDTYDTTAPTDLAQWQQVMGVRLSLVVRSPEWSKDDVTLAPLQWDLGDAAVAGSIQCASNAAHKCLELGLAHTVVNGSTEWKQYRYRMYESLIPLRNLIWNSTVE